MKPTRMLIAALSLAAGCRYQFPDPADTSEVYLCGSDEECAGGYVCRNSICLDAPTFGGAYVVLKGVVEAPAASIFVSVMGRELSAPVELSGAYSIEVPVGNGSELVELYTRGNDGDETVQLASVVDGLAELQTLGGASETVTVAAKPALRLTPFTTAAFGSMCAANGGTPPTTRAQAVVTEQALNRELGEGQLLDAAVAIHHIASMVSPALPTGFTSMKTFACTPAALRAWAADARTGMRGGVDPVASEAAQIASDQTLTVPFVTGYVPTTFMSMLKDRHGAIGFSSERISLNADGNGIFQPPFYLGSPVPANSPLTWTIDGSGRISMSLATPVPVDFETLTVDDVVARCSSSQETLIRGYLTGNQDVELDLAASQVTLLYRGLATDWVAFKATYVERLQPLLAGSTATCSDTQTTRGQESRVWLHPVGLPGLAWPGGSLVGSKWFLPMVLPTTVPYTTATAYPVGTPIFQGTVVNLEGAAVAVVTSPIAASQTGSWMLTAANQLVVTLPGGAQVLVTLLDEQLPLRGALVTWRPAPANDYHYYGPVAVVVPGATMAGDALTNPVGEGWLIGANAASVAPQIGDGLASDNWGAYFVHADNTMQRQFASPYGGFSPPSTYVDGPWSWATSAGGIEFDARRLGTAGGTQTWSSCVPDVSNPACAVYQARHWVPIDVTSDRFVVIEYNLRMLTSMHWDVPTQAWTVSPPTLGWSVPPRLNWYRRTTALPPDFSTPEAISTFLVGKDLVAQGPDIPPFPFGQSENQNLGTSTRCYRRGNLHITSSSLSTTWTLGTLQGAPTVGSLGTCDRSIAGGTTTWSLGVVLIENVQPGTCFDLTVTYPTLTLEGRGNMDPFGKGMTLELYPTTLTPTGHRCDSGVPGDPSVSLGGTPFTGNAQVYWSLP
jgi:hypothetical protein